MDKWIVYVKTSSNIIDKRISRVIVLSIVFYSDIFSNTLNGRRFEQHYSNTKIVG